MDPIKKDKIITFSVIGLVALIMISMLLIFAMYTNGSMSEDQMLMLSSTLSGAMFVIIIVFALISFKSQSALKQYKEMKEEMENENEEE